MTMNERVYENDKPSLLLVDDDELFSRVMSQALSKRGFSVSVAHDVDEAIGISSSQPPEYATVDLSLPGRSGLELVKHLLELDGRRGGQAWRDPLPGQTGRCR